MSLRHPTTKMSKSDPSDASRINLTDTPDLIASKILRATTDSESKITYDPLARPGMSNLVAIYAAVRGVTTEDVVHEFEGVTSTRVFKERLVEVVAEGLGEVRREIDRLRAERGYVEGVLREGAERAKESAEGCLKEVYEVTGLR